MAETFLTVQQAAARLQVTPQTLRGWIRAGAVRAVRLGRAWRIPESALEELAKVNTP